MSCGRLATLGSSPLLLNSNTRPSDRRHMIEEVRSNKVQDDCPPRSEEEGLPTARVRESIPTSRPALWAEESLLWKVACPTLEVR